MSLTSDESKKGVEKTYIKYSEFIAATLDARVYLTKEKLWSLFKYFDPKNNNEITTENIQEIITRNGR